MIEEEEEESVSNIQPEEFIILKEEHTNNLSKLLNEGSEPSPEGDFFDKKPETEKVDIPISEVISKQDHPFIEEKVSAAPKEKILEELAEPFEQETEESIQIEDEDIQKRQKRISIFSRKRSTRLSSYFEQAPSIIQGFRSSIQLMSYEFVPRIGGTTDLVLRISGDFEPVTFNFDDNEMWEKLMEYPNWTSSLIVEEEEEETRFEEIYKEKPICNRKSLYEKHAELNSKITLAKLQNTLLQRRITRYYRKKNMDYVLQENEENPFENLIKYHNRLDEYENLQKFDQNQRFINNVQIDFLKNAKEKKQKTLKENFQALQNREKEVGTGLIHTKTGTEIPDKLIQQLLNRQKVAAEEVQTMRLKYIKLKTMCSDIEEEIRTFDEVDETHHLNYYEKLKAENCSYADKIEEKEAELSKLRIKCKDTIQILAHLKEKISAFDSDIDDLDEMTTYDNERITQLRGHVSVSKKERDMYRAMYRKLKEESGLLMEPELLKDMEQSLQDMKEYKQELKVLKSDFHSKLRKIRCIRKRIEECTGDQIKKTSRRAKESVHFNKPLIRSIASKQKRISNHPVVLPKNVLDHLIQDFQPSVTRINLNKKT